MEPVLKKAIIKRLLLNDPRIKICDIHESIIGEISHSVLFEISDFYKKFCDNNFGDDKSKLILPFDKDIITLFINFVDIFSAKIYSEDIQCDNKRYTASEVIKYSNVVYLLDYMLIAKHFVRVFFDQCMDDVLIYNDDNNEYIAPIDKILILINHTNHLKINKKIIKIVENYSRQYYESSDYRYLSLCSLFYIDHHEYFIKTKFSKENRFKTIKKYFNVFFNLDTIYHRALEQEYIMSCWQNILQLLRRDNLLDIQLCKYIRSIQNDAYNSIFNNLSVGIRNQYNHLLSYDGIASYVPIKFADSIYDKKDHFYVTQDITINIYNFCSHFLVSSNCMENLKIRVSGNYIYSETCNEITTDEFNDILPLEIKINGYRSNRIDCIKINVIDISNKDTIDYIKIRDNIISEISQIDSIENYKLIFDKLTVFKQKIDSCQKDKSITFVNYTERFASEDIRSKIIHIVELGIRFKIKTFVELYERYIHDIKNTVSIVKIELIHATHMSDDPSKKLAYLAIDVFADTLIKAYENTIKHC